MHLRMLYWDTPILKLHCNVFAGPSFVIPTLSLLFAVEDPTREVNFKDMPPTFRALKMDPIPQLPPPRPPQIILW